MPAHGSAELSGSQLRYTPTANYSGSDSLIYTANEGQGGTAQGTISITIIPINDAPTVTLTAAPLTGTTPLDVQLTASASDVDDDVLSYSWVLGDGTMAGDRAALSHRYEQAGTFSATVTVSDGQLRASASQAITVDAFAPALDRSGVTTVADSSAFLYSGDNPIQTGVAAGAIQPQRAAVVRGKVMDGAGQPLAGVQVSIHNHPELGQTLSRADGMVDLAVNGGGLLTLDYSKEGYLPAQRQVNVPWQDYVWAADVVLVLKDPAVTVIDLAANVPVQVARGSVISDGDGTRRATLLIPQGTQAARMLPDGGSEPLTTLSLRFTEYTVGENGPERMPGALPPQSGYTYAVEVSADEAPIKVDGKDVLFSQPVFFYLEDFLEFPVGMSVPVGYYDRERAIWVPDTNGRVVKIISIGGGMAELDSDGDGVADNSAALGITSAERAQLAMLYQAGQSLWRTSLTHLSTFDKNWPVRGPDGAGAPSQQPVLPLDAQEAQQDCQWGSIIGCQNQTLGETLNLTGAPFSLNYRSDRAPGRTAANTLVIPLTEVNPGITTMEWLNRVLAVVKRVDLEIYIAGRRFTQSFPTTVNQRYTFTWDGRDAYGRLVQGAQPTLVRIGYVYDAVYLPPAQDSRAFGGFAGGTSSLNTAREEITFWQEQQTSLGAWDARVQGLGGWSLSAHHAYDPAGRTLYLGDGTIRDTQRIDRIISSVAGSGQNGFAGEGGPASQATFMPVDVATGPDGSIVVADAGHHRMLRIGPDGTLRTIAGTGVPGFSGDGGPAVQAQINTPVQVEVAANGAVFFSDAVNNRVRRIDPAGVITTVAGNGFAGFSGDGGPATQAQINGGVQPLPAPDGSLYIADGGNHRIRRVAPDGTITTIAGTGAPGFSGDGGPARQAQFNFPSDLGLGPDGSLYVGDAYNNRVRRIGPDGMITTVAGGGTLPGTQADGGPATQARLVFDGGGATAAGADLTVSPDGTLYFSERNLYRVRRVTPDGMITTMAGVGTRGFDGNNGSAPQAQLASASGLAVAPDGALIIADTGNYRVRRVGSPLPGFNATDLAVPSEDGCLLYQFSAAGRHLRTLNALTGATLLTLAYDSAGRLSSITDADGNVTTIEHNAAGSPIALVGPYGQRTTLSVDAAGYLAAVTNPAGETISFSYTSQGLLLSMTDPRGNAAHYTYDSLGQLTGATDRAGGAQTLARANLSTSYVVTHTNALNRATSYRVARVNGNDQRRTTIAPDGTIFTSLARQSGAQEVTAPNATAFTAQRGPDPRFGMQAPVLSSQSVAMPSGLKATLTTNQTVTLSNPDNPLSLTAASGQVNINGRVYTSSYAAATRQFTDSTPVGRQTVTTVDAQGRPTRVQVAGLDPLSYSYDSRGRPVTISQGSGASARTVTFSYDGNGYLASITDPLGRMVSFDYDAAGRVTQQTMPDGRVIAYGYDANGNLATLTPPGRPAHNFGYMPLDLPASYTPPALSGAGATQYSYNAARQLTRLTRPDGTTVDLDYDGGGRLSALATPHGTTTYSYTAGTGQLDGISAPGGIILRYSYDGALTTGETWLGPVAGSVGYSYDSSLRLTSQQVNGANPVAFQYDNDSLLTAAGALALAYHAQSGLLTGTTLGGVADSWGYNSFGEPTSYTASYNGAARYAVTYTRDALGRITQKTETVAGVTTTYAYSYDLAGRLVEVRRDGVVSEQYSYDSNGNRLSATVNGATATGSYDVQDRLLSYGANAYTYTPNGALLSKTSGGQTAGYSYNAQGDLIGVALPDGRQISYVIDGANRRIGKRIDGTLAQGFLYEGWLRPVAELDGAGNIVSRFVYAEHANVPSYMIRGGATYRIITDQLGSPRLVINTATGVVAQQIDYDAWGNVTQDSNPGLQPFGFAGGLYDRDTGLVRFGARDYDPQAGRWTAKDPIGFAGGSANLYGYVNNSPQNLFDPAGLELSVTDVVFEDIIAKIKERIRGTKSGADLLGLVEAPGYVVKFKEGNGSQMGGPGKYVPMKSSRCGDDVFDPVVYFDPWTPYYIVTSEGVVMASRERVIAHELAHAVYGGLDEYQRERIAMHIENIIMRELGEPPRMLYDIYESYEEAEKVYKDKRGAWWK